MVVLHRLIDANAARRPVFHHMMKRGRQSRTEAAWARAIEWRSRRVPAFVAVELIFSAFGPRKRGLRLSVRGIGGLLEGSPTMPGISGIPGMVDHAPYR